MIKFGIKYPQDIYFTNVKEKNLYILTFCENNAKPKNKLSGIADIS